jgi:hypothetical protein
MLDERGNFTDYYKNFMRRVSIKREEVQDIQSLIINAKLHIKTINQINYNVSSHNTQKNQIKKYTYDNKIDINHSEESKPLSILSKDSTKIRLDRRGNLIKKGSKVHKITFTDDVDRKQLVEEVNVESFKKYIKDDDEEEEVREILVPSEVKQYNIQNNKIKTCACCILF